MSSRHALNRRSLLQLAGGSAALAGWLGSAIRRAEGAAAPKRLMLVHRPNGSIREDWLRNGAPGPILMPFANVWSYAVALKGVDVRPSNGSTGGSHEAGLLTTMTGANLGATDRTNDDFRSTAESLDQTLAKNAPALKGTRVPSLQIGAHGNQDGGNEVPNCTMSYSGASSPLYPVLNPADVYKRLFGDTVMPGGGSTTAQTELVKARARRQSVLDFVRGDLARVRKAIPSSSAGDLDAHEAAIREIEQAMDGGGTPMPAACAPPMLGSEKAGGDYLNTAKVGAMQFKLVVAAFVCDLTRVVTFQWATGASNLAFNPLGAGNHHSTSHANARGPLSAVDKWYSEQTATLIQQLVDTADPAGGKLIDSTLVWYLNEVSEGWNHSFDDYPYVLFGGDAVGLKARGRVVDVSGQNKTSNDVWSSIAPAFGTTLGSFKTKAGGPISGLVTV